MHRRPEEGLTNGGLTNGALTNGALTNGGLTNGGLTNGGLPNARRGQARVQKARRPFDSPIVLVWLSAGVVYVLSGSGRTAEREHRMAGSLRRPAAGGACSGKQPGEEPWRVSCRNCPRLGPLFRSEPPA